MHTYKGFLYANDYYHVHFNTQLKYVYVWMDMYFCVSMRVTQNMHSIYVYLIILLTNNDCGIVCNQFICLTYLELCRYMMMMIHATVVILMIMIMMMMVQLMRGVLMCCSDNQIGLGKIVMINSVNLISNIN